MSSTSRWERTGRHALSCAPGDRPQSLEPIECFGRSNVDTVAPPIATAAAHPPNPAELARRAQQLRSARYAPRCTRSHVPAVSTQIAKSTLPLNLRLTVSNTLAQVAPDCLERVAFHDHVVHWLAGQRYSRELGKACYIFRVVLSRASRYSLRGRRSGATASRRGACCLRVARAHRVAVAHPPWRKRAVEAVQAGLFCGFEAALSDWESTTIQ